jgi:hypothetical protein
VPAAPTASAPTNFLIRTPRHHQHQKPHEHLTHQTGQKVQARRVNSAVPLQP